MSPRAVRRIVMAVCVAGIGGMIASSVVDNDGMAMTAGIVTAIAVLCLIVSTAVTAEPATHVSAVGGTDNAETLAANVEEAVSTLVEGGADEARTRALVAAAVRLGRARAEAGLR